MFHLVQGNKNYGTYVCICIHVREHTQVHVPACACVRAYVLTCTHIHVCLPVHVCVSRL